MSMLTPPGMGGKYRVKGDRYPRMRRPRHRRRLVAGSLAGALALGMLGWGTIQLVDVFTGGVTTARASAESAEGTPAEGRGERQGKDQARATCRPAASARPAGQAAAAAGLPEPGRVTVNILNATTRKGLARRTADQLEERGFAVGEVTNAPPELDGKVEGAGLLVGARDETGRSALKLLGTHFDDAATRHDEARTDGTFDLVIGTGFTGLTPEPRADAALAALTEPRTPKPSPSC